MTCRVNHCPIGLKQTIVNFKHLKLKLWFLPNEKPTKLFTPIGFVAGRGPSQMETFANIIVKGLSRWNNLFPYVALYPKLGSFVSFFCVGFFWFSVWLDISIYPFWAKECRYVFLKAKLVLHVFDMSLVFVCSAWR